MEQTEQGETQNARERAVAAKPLGDPPLSPVRRYLSGNAFCMPSIFVYRRFFAVCILSVSESVGFATESILSPTHAQSEKQCIILSAETEKKPVCKKIVKFSA